MVGIEGVAMVEAVVGRWAPNDLAFIEELEFLSGRGAASLRMVALFQRRDSIGWPAVDRPMFRVSLCFDGVRCLRLAEFGGGRVQVMGFDIFSIADRGWEGAKFEVEDYENGRIRFTCNEVQIVGVEEMTL